MFQPVNHEQHVHASVLVVGLVTFVCVGVAACFALVAVAFFLVVQLFLMVLQATAEMCSCIAAIWVTADPLLKVLLLAALVYGGFRFYQSRKGRRYA